MKILIVDDREDARYLLETLLKANGHIVGPAGNGVEALERLKSGGVDLIVSDILMPVMDGFQLCRKVKTDKALRHIPFIIYTATYTGPKDEEFALKIGADRFIIKPCEPDTFIAAVRDVTATAKRRDIAPMPTPLQEKEIFKLYNERLVRKLEQKMSQLEKEVQMRKETEKNLRESEEKFRYFFDHSIVGKSVTFPSGEMQVNKAFREMLGYSRDEFSNLKWQKITHPDDVEFSNKVVDSIRSGEKDSEQFTKRYIHKNGSVVWADVSTVARKDKKGNLLYLMTTISDITEKKRAQEALIAMTSRQEAILSAIPDIIMEVDHNKIYTWANPSGSQFFGDDVIGKEAADYFEGEQETYQTLQPLFNGHEDVVYIESWQRRKDGRKRLLAWWCRVLKDASGNVSGALSSARDITRQRQTEAALKESEGRFRTLVEQSPLGISLITKGGRYQYLNPAFRDIFGYTVEDIPTGDQWFKKAFPDKNDRDTAIKAWIEDQRQVGIGQQRPRVFTVTCKDGSRKDILFRPVTMENRDQFVIYEDLTEKAVLERQLQQAQRMESIGRLAGGVAHDFNNMLGVIIGHAELATYKMDPSSPACADIAEIRKAAERSTDLTRQLLAFARRQTAAPKVLDLNDTVTGMLKILRRLIGEDIDLAWKPGATLWPVKIDPAQIDQILANLCVNSRDAIAGVGKVTIETQNITLDDTYCADRAGFVPGAYVMLAVSDDGCGMDKETLENLFEPFFTTKEVGKGTGMGLATVYGIVKQNNGFVNVYSELGRGATFKIYFPKTRETAKAKGAPVSGTIARGTETVLLVEDEEAILSLGKSVLERFGYTVLAARTPTEAIAMTEHYEGPIPLLITDVVMPEMNGNELRERIQGLKPNIKVLFMSGYTTNVIMHRGILESDVHFLQKPFSVNSLAGKVREVLDG